MEGLTYFERLKSIYRCYVNEDPAKGEVVKFLNEKFNIPNSTASKWQKDNDIPDSEVRYKLSKYFNLHTDIWTDNTWTDPVNLEQHIEDFRLIVKSEEEKEKLDHVVYKKADFSDNHPKAIHEHALQLKKEGKIRSALEHVERLLTLHSRYVYKRYNEILLLKAVLLSHDAIREFDEAIKILQLLYSAMEYHLKNPEVLTLLGSNYKRKAFFDDSGELKKPNDIDESYLHASLENYEQAVKIRSSERYYDAINIAYLKKMLFDIPKQEVQALRLSEPNWTPDPNSWWEKATSAEFYMLAKDYENAKREINEFLENASPSPHDVSATLRQMRLYLHLKPEDSHVKNLYMHIEESLRVINADSLKTNHVRIHHA